MLLFALVQSSTSTPKEAAADIQTANILRRFDSLPLEEKQRIATEVLTTVLSLDHPLCESARSLLSDVRLKNASKTPQGALSVYSSVDYASALKLKTKILTPENKRWLHFQERHLPAGIQNRYSRWEWDYAADAFHTPTRVQPRDTLLALLNGRWPDSGRLAAYAEGSLDHARDFGAVADYFEHAYRDRSGRVYAEIRLYDLWNSQTEFGISDVEAIAFLRLIEGNTKIVSPIPSSLHDSIYQLIEDRFTPYRAYRDLRHALAQRMLNPNGSIPRIYADIIPTIDAAWILMEHNPRRMASFLAQHGHDRSDFLTAIGKRIPTEGPEREKSPWVEQSQARATLPGLIRSTTLDLLADEGLLGFHRR